MSDTQQSPATSTSSKTVTAPRQLSAMDEMDRLFDTFLSKRWLSPFSWEMPNLFKAPSLSERLPSVDVIERDNEVVLRAEVPGIDKKDLDISVTENSITIKGSSKSETKEEQGDYWRQEIHQGSFMRTIALPANCDSASAKAQFNNGVLEITMNKTNKSQRVNVKVQ